MQTYKTIVGLVTAAQNLFAKSTTASAEADNASTEAQIANSSARVASKQQKPKQILQPQLHKLLILKQKFQL